MPSPISMAKIETLIQDIHKLLGPEDSNLNEDLVDRQVGIFSQHVEQQLRDFLKEKPTYRKGLRLSGIGRPPRQLWYDNQCEEQPIPLDASTRIKFLYGHILEELLILLTVLSGHKVTEAQKEIHVEGVKGHQDCKIDDVLVDCKSTSHRGFDKFKNCTLEDDDPFGYIEQISAYAEGKIKQLKKVITSSVPPDKCYSDVADGASGNRKLAIGCLYCNHKKLCWQDANQGQGIRVFQYAQSKKYLTKVSRTPDVPEVLDW
jgi:hypothetical protein